MRRFINLTQYPTEYFEKLVSFIQKLNPATAVARFVIKTSTTCGINGEAFWLGPTEPGGAVFPVAIEVYLSTPCARQYPTEEQYVPELPPITLYDWEEELVLTLAHEMRHAEQFTTSLGDELDWDLEPDAEHFGYQVVKAWRKHKAVKRAA